VCDIEQRSLDNSLEPSDSPAKQDNDTFVDINRIMIEADNMTAKVDENRLLEDDDDDYLCERNLWERSCPSISFRADQSLHSENGTSESRDWQSHTEEDGRKLNTSDQQEFSAHAGIASIISEFSASPDLRKTAEWGIQEWDIRMITGKRKVNDTICYLVRWEETWEPERALGNVRELIDGFEARRRARLPGRDGLRKRQAGDGRPDVREGLNGKKRRLEA